MKGRGIYQILNKINGKRYIGSAAKLRKRELNHLSELRRNIHKNSYLQRAWRKYGEKSFTFEVLEYVDDPAMLTEREDYYIALYKTTNRRYGYNLSPVAESRLGAVLSEATKRKIGMANKGNKNMLGHKHTEEAKQKISIAIQAKWEDPEYRERVINSMRGNKNCLGRKLTKETRQKLREAATGRRHTEAAKEKMSRKRRGEDNPAAKLTRPEVKDILSLLGEGRLTQREIAAIYGVSQGQISSIKRGMSWSDNNADNQS